MVKLEEGKKYKLISLADGDAFEDDVLIGKTLTYIGNDQFKDESYSGYYFIEGFQVEECCGQDCCETPPREAEFATMELEEQELDFKPIQDKRQFETGAVRDNNQGKPFVHNLLGYTRLRFGYHMSKNATKYGENNFLLGIPNNVALESLDRHLAQYLAGDRSEDHLSAILFGVQLVMMNEEREGITANHFVK